MINFKDIEKKWQKYWEENNTYKFNKERIDNKLYCLEMFSYPSGAKLHVGHWYNFGVTDTWARFKRMQGYEVFHPMGFDAFGLPAENYAIKTGVHPKDSTMNNIATMESQLKKMGATYDWDYEVITCNPEYYKWTQWMFLQLYKNNLAYKKEAPVNWCPSCNTVLANEQVINGHCERCETVVERKKLSQWFFKITDYAEELLNDLDKIDWPERTKNLQRNWIGKSVGAQVEFEVLGSNEKFEVFTTRVDTLYGATYVVLAPENDLVDSITTDEYKAAVENYKNETSKVSEIDRMAVTKEKTGVFTGAYAINPINGRKIPIWISDYVIASYGTGAVMAVPAHDERDYEFAKKFDIPIIEVIKGGDISKEAYVGDGILINSQDLNGKNNREAMKDIVGKLAKNGKGRFVNNYRLRDWLVSRQRYWGAPIPIVYCDQCGMVPVPESDLPVELPYDVEFKPDGKSPLAKSEAFVNCTCPICGKPAKREVDTLDTFVCSSWYFLRYPDAKNDKEPFNKEWIDKILPVDKYVGGIEHACMHLLYARFFTKALRDMGYLSFDEPFKSLVHQGIILGADGEKMSKSRGNTVSPDDYIDKYGSDVFRTYLMFGFNYIDGGPWSDDGLKAVVRFYDRVTRLIETNISDHSNYFDELDKVLNSTIKNVTIDTERFQFNTSISRIMEYVNSLYKYVGDKKDFSKYYLEQLVLLIAPFAPHLGEELWQTLGYNESVFNQKWPSYDESKIQDETFELVIQVNGKVRGREVVSNDITEDQMKEIALKNEASLKFIEGFEVVKVITIPKKLVNIVVK